MLPTALTRAQSLIEGIGKTSCLLAIVWLTVILHASAAQAATSGPAPADTLRTKYAAVASQLHNNAFQQPIVLKSTESSDNLEGEVYALVDYPFATISNTFKDPVHWCDVLILHLNTKYCHVSADTGRTVLAANVGQKIDQQLADTYRLEFIYKIEAAADGYLEVSLNADRGPVGTKDYRIFLEAIPLDGKHSFLHFTYSYAYGWAGRVAMQTYLATTGRNKVGFTVTGTTPDGEPDYIRGVRGVVERNTMRYYLAIEAYLSALNAPQAGQFEKRLQNWFSSTERYSRQLHEIEGAAYLDMKRKEYLRQQTEG